MTDKIQKQKEKLIKIGKKCTDLAEKHRKERMEFDKLFEKIYGIEFNENMDNIIDCLDYGNSDFNLEDLEKNIIFCRDSCNYELDITKLKNIDGGIQHSSQA